MEDIIGELIGKFTTTMPGGEDKLVWDYGGSALVDGGRSLRDLNRALRMNLPLEGAKPFERINFGPFPRHSGSGSISKDRRLTHGNRANPEPYDKNSAVIPPHSLNASRDFSQGSVQQPPPTN